MSDFKFKSTVDPKQLAKVFMPAAKQWSKNMPVEQFAQVQSKILVDFVLGGRPGRAYYLEAPNGDIAASVIVTHHKGFYKEPTRGMSSAIPDPTTFGVSPATGLLVSYVVTAQEYRGQGLMRKLLERVISHTEEELLQKELAKSSDGKDSFRLMVTSEGKVDRTLANYYMSKKYVWYLYSGIDRTYEKFGFKAYPLDGYKIPISAGNSEVGQLVKKLLSNSASEAGVGKKLRLLDRSKKLDLDLISFILQGRELDLLTDLNTDDFHSELSGGRRSSLSLTNIGSALLTTEKGSTNELSAISEKLEHVTITPSSRRKSSIQHMAVPKFGLQPNMDLLDSNFVNDKILCEAGSVKEYTNICGAILTNELQQKSFYILWTLVMMSQVHIVGVGELKLDVFGALVDPLGLTNPPQRRRGSSFTGLNDISGLNLQDLDLLVSTALHVANKRRFKGMSSYVCVTKNDLPATVPAAVLHDFFMNYVSLGEKSKAVEFVQDFSSQHILPMLRKFGLSNPEFELDWTSNSMLSWG